MTLPPLHSLLPSLSLTSWLTPALPSIKDELSHTPLELCLVIPDWARNPLRLQQLFVFSVTTRGIFMSTVQSTNVLTAINVLQATPSTVALATTVLLPMLRSPLPRLSRPAMHPL